MTNGVGAAEIEAAAERLRGQVVATPLIGGLLLPGAQPGMDLRVKPETLQPSGSLYFRGAMHWLLRQLGAPKGLVLHGIDRPVLAGATAAAWSRLPAVAFTVGEPDARVWSLLKNLGCEVRPRPTAEEASRDAEGVRASQGYHVLPGLEDPDYLAGIATVGLELARDLPTDTEVVVVSPADVGSAVALGLAAAGVSVRVEAVDDYGCPAPDGLLEAVRTALRLDVGPASLAALHWALEHGAGPRCAVLGC